MEKNMEVLDNRPDFDGIMDMLGHYVKLRGGGMKVRNNGILYELLDDNLDVVEQYTIDNEKQFLKSAMNSWTYGSDVLAFYRVIFDGCRVDD